MPRSPWSTRIRPLTLRSSGPTPRWTTVPTTRSPRPRPSPRSVRSRSARGPPPRRTPPRTSGRRRRRPTSPMRSARPIPPTSCRRSHGSRPT
ncbi:hypothetical protein DMP15_00070 [Pseudonocardia sp. UM4_GMWB1]